MKSYPNLSMVLLAILLILSVSYTTSKPKGFPFSSSKLQIPSTDQVGQFKTLYYNQKVSHFNYQPTGTFKQKYLIDVSKWDGDKRSPILFYCGNQGPIDMFIKNTGFYNDIVSSELKGILVYAEHRYFGTSMPFGDQKTSYQKQNLVYLTTEEALMDYVEFLKFIKKTYCSTCPVVAFGGSYGGMLATWIRIKYPFIVDIAHAASAPIYYYRNREKLDLNIFYQLVTKNYAMHSENCPNVIRQAFNRLNKYAQSSNAPIKQISQYFNLCKPLKTYTDIYLLMQFLNDGYAYMAMLNYPYPTSFLKNLTAWPANSSCQPLSTVKDTDSDAILFTSVRKSVEYYYSFNKTQCNQIYQDSSSDQDMSGWNVLACGDQAMPMTMTGTKDMFYPMNFDYDAYSKSCKDQFGIQPDYQYTLNHFGGVKDSDYLSASRIIFTNGGLDPWSGASPVTNLSDTLISCFIPNGAHHLDLRSPNDADPQDVRKCRKLVIDKLRQWLGKNEPIYQQNNLKVENEEIMIE